MARKTQNTGRRLIKLSDNGDPYGLDEEVGDVYDEEAEDASPAPDMTDELAALSRSVSGMRRSITTLAKAQALIINALRKQQENFVPDYEEDTDVMDIDDPDSYDEEEELSLALGDAEESYTELPTDVVPRVGDPVEKGRKVAKSPNVARRLPKIKKDDTATTFGEKDSDTPGNRAYDQKDPGGREATLIGGEAGDGPGPAESVIKRAVDARLAQLGLILKSDGPGIGTRGGDPVDVAELNKRVGNMSFQEINRLRAELGELPAGVL